MTLVACSDDGSCNMVDDFDANDSGRTAGPRPAPSASRVTEPGGHRRPGRANPSAASTAAEVLRHVLENLAREAQSAHVRAWARRLLRHGQAASSEEPE